MGKYLYPPIENCFYSRDYRKGSLDNKWEDWKVKLDKGSGCEIEQIEDSKLLPSVLEKLRFMNTLNKVSIGIFGTVEYFEVKHPYLRVFSDKADYECEKLSK